MSHTHVISRIVRCAPLLALTLLAVGCARAAPTAPAAPAADAPATTAAADGTTPQGPPAVEASGPEQPAPAVPAPLALDIASLPIGGSADDDSAVHQCVSVGWLGSEIPHGVTITVTAVRFEP